MMPKSSDINFVLEEFALGSPSQHLVDRFSIGFPRDGRFVACEGRRKVHAITAPTKENGAEFLRRANAGLVVSASLPEAAGKEILYARQGNGAGFNSDLITETLAAAPNLATIFIHGRLARDREEAGKLLALASKNGIQLRTGSVMTTALLIPETTLPDTPIEELLVVVQGSKPDAEYFGLEAACGLLGKNLKPGKLAVAKATTGPAVWDKLRGGKLLSAAVSRSSNILGAPEKDGRTQDIVGLGIYDKLAKEPRLLEIEAANPARINILVMDGALADFNFAARLHNGQIVSARIDQPQRPNQENYSRLAARIMDFFNGQPHPFHNANSIFICEALGSAGM